MVFIKVHLPAAGKCYVWRFAGDPGRRHATSLEGVSLVGGLGGGRGVIP